MILKLMKLGKQCSRQLVVNMMTFVTSRILKKIFRFKKKKLKIVLGKIRFDETAQIIRRVTYKKGDQILDNILIKSS